MIHPTAIIDPTAKIADNVQIGPWSIIGPEVEIGEGTVVGSHVVINGPTKIGKNNQIFQFASVGEVPQDLKFHGERVYLEIGDNNVIREFTTINRGTGAGGSITKIGNNNLIMAYVHIAHDCIVGNYCVFSNNTSLAGHVLVDDYVVFAGYSGAHQFTILGAHSIIGSNTKIKKDILPYLRVSGDPAEPYGLNVVGLQRRGFSSETITILRRAYRTIFRKGLTVDQAIAELRGYLDSCPEVQLFIDGLERSKLGIAREVRSNVNAETEDE